MVVTRRLCLSFFILALDHLAIGQWRPMEAWAGPEASGWQENPAELSQYAPKILPDLVPN